MPLRQPHKSITFIIHKCKSLSYKSQKVPPQSPPLMNQLQQIVTVNPQQLCFFTELTTEAETVQVWEGWKSLTPSSTNCQLRSLGVNSRMMPDLEMSLDVTPVSSVQMNLLQDESHGYNKPARYM